MKGLFDSDLVVNKLSGTDTTKYISGYTIYAPQQKERTVINNLPEFYPELPNGGI